jgi:hypothetical protein
MERRTYGTALAGCMGVGAPVAQFGGSDQRKAVALHIDTPPCKTHTVHIWLIVPGGVSMCNVCKIGPVVSLRDNVPERDRRAAVSVSRLLKRAHRHVYTDFPVRYVIYIHSVDLTEKRICWVPSQ